MIGNIFLVTQRKIEKIFFIHEKPNYHEKTKMNSNQELAQSLKNFLGEHIFSSNNQNPLQTEFMPPVIVLGIIPPFQLQQQTQQQQLRQQQIEQQQQFDSPQRQFEQQQRQYQQQQLEFEQQPLFQSQTLENEIYRVPSNEDWTKTVAQAVVDTLQSKNSNKRKRIVLEGHFSPRKRKTIERGCKKYNLLPEFESDPSEVTTKKVTIGEEYTYISNLCDFAVYHSNNQTLPSCYPKKQSKETIKKFDLLIDLCRALEIEIGQSVLVEKGTKVSEEAWKWIENNKLEMKMLFGSKGHVTCKPIKHKTISIVVRLMNFMFPGILKKSIQKSPKSTSYCFTWNIQNHIQSILEKQPEIKTLLSDCWTMNN